MLAVAEHEQGAVDFIPRIATGFCSGMARTGGLCGAVSGGMMAISLSRGRDVPSDNIDHCYQAVREFLNQFAAQFKSINCYELTGVHLDTPEGQEAFRLKGQNQLCTEYVGEATRMVVELLEQP